jgi:hypothetical protein
MLPAVFLSGGEDFAVAVAALAYDKGNRSSGFEGGSDPCGNIYF